MTFDLILNMRELMLSPYQWGHQKDEGLEHQCQKEQVSVRPQTVLVQHRQVQNPTNIVKLIESITEAREEWKERFRSQLKRVIPRRVWISKRISLQLIVVVVLDEAEDKALIAGGLGESTGARAELAQIKYIDVPSRSLSQLFNCNRLHKCGKSIFYACHKTHLWTLPLCFIDKYILFIHSAWIGPCIS